MKNQTMQIVGFLLSAVFVVTGIFLAKFTAQPAVLVWGFIGVGGATLALTLVLKALVPLLPRDWEEKQMALERKLLEEEEKARSQEQSGKKG